MSEPTESTVARLRQALNVRELRAARVDIHDHFDD